MNTKDYFKDMYTDFFGVESGPRFSVKVIKDDKTIEDEKQEETNQEEMTSLINKINDLYITEESKNLLKKIIEYMRKYNEKIETQYVPFRLIINVNMKAVIFKEIYYLKKQNKKCRLKEEANKMVCMGRTILIAQSKKCLAQ